MAWLDAIPVNWFIFGTSVLAGIILFLILTQIPDDEEEKMEEGKEPEKEMTAKTMEAVEVEKPKTTRKTSKSKPKGRSSKK